MRLEVAGPAADVTDFLQSLRSEAPPQARIDSVETHELPPDAASLSADAGFEIRPAAGDAAPRPTIPADLATCDACREEIGDPRQRRYRYPFTNCTNCGPRWSIIRQLPYDRPRTSMAQFPLCPECQAEYDAPADRRFHAQPVACPKCGPQLRTLDAQGRLHAERERALQAAADAMVAGHVVALQGLGGFQLLVDATQAAAVDACGEENIVPIGLLPSCFPPWRQCGNAACSPKTKPASCSRPPRLSSCCNGETWRLRRRPTPTRRASEAPLRANPNSSPALG